MSKQADFRCSPYRVLDRKSWAALRADTPMTLSDDELLQLSGVIDRMSIDEAVDIYLPLSRLLNLHVAASQELSVVTSKFLGSDQPGKSPFIIGLAGSVAVGKSTVARVLCALLSRWEDHPRVDILPTDGFLYSNRELEKWGIMHRKGFPESYDKRRLIRFLYALKSSRRNIKVPVYSHFAYDVMDETRIIDNPDVLIIEGLNVLQPAELAKDGKATPYVSDFLDFSIYLDAEEDVIRNWYVKRFLRLRQTAFRDPASYFHRYASMNDRKAEQTALDIWERINLPNLQQNISRTRQRADLILHKDPTHNVRSVLLRQV